MSAAPATFDEELEWIFQDLMVQKITVAQAKTGIKTSIERYLPKVNQKPVFKDNAHDMLYKQGYIHAIDDMKTNLRRSTE